MASPRLSGVTFGVEIEFVASYLSKNPNDKTAMETTIKALVEKGITVFDSAFPDATNKFSKWRVDVDQTIKGDAEDSITGKEKRQPSGQETVVENGETKYVVYEGVEVVSPVYKASKHEEATNDIARVLKAIRSTFREIWVNDTCGIHVHVGNGGDLDDLKALKNLSWILSTFETQLDAIHPPTRIAKDKTCQSWAQNLNFKGMGKGKRYNEIKKASSVYNLAMIMCLNERYQSYSFYNLIHKGKNTIEFRQHAGSLQVRDIMIWVRLVTALFAFAQDSPQDVVDALVRGSIEGIPPPVTLYSLMDKFGVPDLKAAYPPSSLYQHEIGDN